MPEQAFSESPAKRGNGFFSISLPLLLVALAAAPFFLSSARGRGGLHEPLSQRPIRMARIQHLPRQAHLKLNDSEWTSVNWAGYAVTGAQGSVTDVQASWVVPPVSCSATSADVPNVFASFWTGIDGWTSSTVEQIGTDSDCENAKGTYTPKGTYYAWFEFYPAGSFYVGNPNTNFAGYPVAPGDQISAEVKSTGSCGTGPRGHGGGGLEFTVTIEDLSQSPQWTFTTNSCVSNAEQSSAEWITETPYGCRTKSRYCYLPNFGMAAYGDNSTPLNHVVAESATVTGVTGPLGAPLGSFGNSVQQSIMVDANAPSTNIPSADVMAYPSPSCASYPLKTSGNEGLVASCSQQSSIINDVGGGSGTSFGMEYNNAGP